MSEGYPEPFYTWKFTEMNKLVETCVGVSARNWVQNFSHDNTLLMISAAKGYGEHDFALCKPGIQQPVIHFPTEQAKQWWGEHLRVLHDDKILIIRNVGSISSTQSKPEPETLEHIDVWNLHYAPAAKQLIKHVNREEETLTLVESYENRTCVNRWNYATRKHLNKTCFPGIQVQKAAFRGDYLLLAFENSLSLLQQQGSQLVNLWTKDFSNLYADYSELSPDNKPIASLSKSASIEFSRNQENIILNARYYGWRLPSIMVINTPDGEIREHTFLSDNGKCSTAIIDPQTRYIAIPPDCDFLANKRSVSQQTKPMQLLKVDGSVIRISPDGDVLAVKKKGEIFLWRNQSGKKGKP